jgi:hypothetical protein
MRMARRCTSCAAPIAFIEAPSGKWMPVDPELVKTFGVEPVKDEVGVKVLVTERGHVVRYIERSLTARDAEAIEGYQPHFATCSHPSAHRR